MPMKSRSSRAVLLCAAALTLAACAAQPEGPSPTETAALPSMKWADVFETPEWARSKTTAGDKPLVARKVTPSDLVDANGACPAPEPIAAPEAAAGSESAETPAQQPTVTGGIALAMTECDVVHRAGPPSQVEIGGEGEKRMVTLTFLQGPWPGIYRFRDGHLFSIERAAVPETAKPKRQAKPAPSGPAQIRVGPGN